MKREQEEAAAAEETSASARLRKELDSVRAEFEASTSRRREEIDRARERGRDEAARSLLDIVDDCDRALTHIGAGDERVASGIEQLRARALRHFTELGYESFGIEGEAFDPQQHEAVSVKPGDGTDGEILEVHRRGWKRGDAIIRPTMVTVIQGDLEREPDNELSLEDEVERVPRRRHRPGWQPQDEEQSQENMQEPPQSHQQAQVLPPEEKAEEVENADDSQPQAETTRLSWQAPETEPVGLENYVCPYGIVGCKQDCLGCRALPPLDSEEEMGEDWFAEDFGSDNPFAEEAFVEPKPAGPPNPFFDLDEADE